MKILIIGASGYLGARLYFDLKDKFKVVGTYNKNQLHKSFIQLDITNKNQVEEVFQKYEPDIIVQTANYSSPRQAFNNNNAFIKLNLDSTEYIREAADVIGARVIFISSFAAITPDNIYGELKLKSEKIIEKTKAGYLILRPSLILGFSSNTTNDSFFNRVLKLVDSNNIGEFDASWKFQPTYVSHISEVIIAIIEKDIFNKIIHIFCPSIETQYSTAIDISEPFNVEIKPIDKKMSMGVQEKKEDELINLGLPTCSYVNMVKKIHEEIENSDRFKL